MCYYIIMYCGACVMHVAMYSFAIDAEKDGIITIYLFDAICTVLFYFFSQIEFTSMYTNSINIVLCRDL